MTALPAWAKALSQSEEFAKEQEKLGNVWTFLGFEKDILNVDDWFKATLGGRSIFVQRFEQGLRGFENICSHRFHPIRIEEKGNGPVVCGFHQWRYDACGQAVGVPKCKQMYGQLPKELNASLPKIELSVCGSLIFGRLGDDGPSLKAWLGPSYDILSHLTADLELAGEIDLQVKAHWKLMMEITLDDYHLVAVHPTTFGKKGFLPLEHIKYFRFGAHSAFMPSGRSNELEIMAQECREKRFLPRGYSILQFFPTFIVVLVKATRFCGDDYWYLLTEHFTALSNDRTRLHSHFFPLPFSKSAGPLRRLVRKVARPFVNFGMKYYSTQLHREDNQVCENLQKVSHQINANMILSNQEERVGWFEEEYARYVLSENDQ